MSIRKTLRKKESLARSISEVKRAEIELVRSAHSVISSLLVDSPFPPP